MNEIKSLPLVRRAVSDDAERLAEIQARSVTICGRQFYAAPVLDAWAWGDEKREACRGWIGERGVQVMVCEHHETVLAFSIYVAKPDSIYLHSLYCDPEAIGRGIGRMLLNDVERFATTSAKRYLTVQSSLNAVDFYRTLGFLRLRDGFQEIGRDRLRWDYVAMGKTMGAAKIGRGGD